jgi:hypothetical protein
VGADGTPAQLISGELLPALKQPGSGGIWLICQFAPGSLVNYDPPLTTYTSPGLDLSWPGREAPGAWCIGSAPPSLAADMSDLRFAPVDVYGCSKASDGYGQSFTTPGRETGDTVAGDLTTVVNFQSGSSISAVEQTNREYNLYIAGALIGTGASIIAAWAVALLTTVRDADLIVSPSVRPRASRRSGM